MSYEILTIDVKNFTIENQKKILEIEGVHQIGCDCNSNYFAIVKNDEAITKIMDILAMDTIEN